MTAHLSWSSYWTVVAVLLGVYYPVVAWSFLRLNDKPRWTQEEHPEPPVREVWMDLTLAALEETVLHAQKKRYHPDEVILALRQKMEQLKGGVGDTIGLPDGKQSV